MLGPAVEAEALAQESRRDVGGDQRALDDERARTAHGIEQGIALGRDLGPAGAQQQCRGQILLERCGGTGLAVAALMQRLAREIQAEGQAVAVSVEVNAQIRIVGIDAWTSPVEPVEAIGDGVLDLEDGEMWVGDALELAVELNGEGAIRGQMIFPGDLQRTVVDLVRAAQRHLRQRQEDAVGDPRPETGAIAVLDPARETRPAARLGGPRHPESGQLLGQQTTEVLGGGGKENMIRHARGGTPGEVAEPGCRVRIGRDFPPPGL